MGKLNHDLQILHFSHPHPLHLFSLPAPSQLSQISAPASPCSACKLPLPTAATGGADAFIYNCPDCNFSIHLSCTKFPQLITHPAHPYHPLSLLPTTTYPGGFFNCDACSRRGSGFSYHCSQCDFDLHVLCASKPLSVNNPFHPHPLGLTFGSPYEMKGFSCDICRKIGTQQWLYRCVPCEFDVHMECVNSRPAGVVMQPPLQHNYSLPNPSHQQNHILYTNNQNHLVHSASTSGRLQNNFPLGTVVGMGPNYTDGNTNTRPQNNYPQGTVIGVVPGYNSGNANTQNNYPQAAGGGPGYNGGNNSNNNNNNNNTANDMANAAMTGFVEGAAQQVGQSFVQSLLGGGGGGGGGGGDDGGGDSSSFFGSIFSGNNSD